jgi:hypothetical protein
MVAVEFARFLGLPVTRTANLTDVVNAVCVTAVRLHVELVLVDEIHNISLATRAGAEVSDQLKYFAERLPATFIYAGVDVERAGLFAGPRWQRKNHQSPSGRHPSRSRSRNPPRRDDQRQAGTFEGSQRVRPILRRLPIAVRPAHHETLNSYIARLTNVHGLTYRDLWLSLSKRIRPTLPRRLLVAERLAALTGHPLSALQRALPELRDPPPDWSQLRHLAQWACPLCTAPHPGGRVQRFFAHHEFLCAEHGYWFGPAEKVGKGTVEPLGAVPHPRQVSDHIPELPEAQRRHHRLARRHGWLRCFNGFEASLSLCVGLRPYGEPSPEDPWTVRLERLVRIERLGIRFKAFDGWLFIAALYPETVRLAELFFSPAGRLLAEKATSSDGDPTGAIAQLNREIGPAGMDIFDSFTVQGWLKGALGAERLKPRLTFPETRGRTIDGTPSARLEFRELEHQREARREFRKHRHPGAWRLPRNIEYVSERQTAASQEKGSDANSDFNVHGMLSSREPRLSHEHQMDHDQASTPCHAGVHRVDHPRSLFLGGRAAPDLALGPRGGEAADHGQAGAEQPSQSDGQNRGPDQGHQPQRARSVQEGQ